jgi:electron transfer flavoprotein alpha subunit
MTILVIAEHNNTTLKPATLNVIGAASQLAQQLQSEIHVVVMGYQCAAVAQAASQIAGVTKILHADDVGYQHGLAEVLTPLLLQFAPNYSHVLIAATAWGKALLPRVAALLDMAQISEISAILTPQQFVRPIYAGNALATVESNEAIQFITVRATAFAAASDNDVVSAAVIEPITIPAITHTTSRYIGQELSVSARPELTAARIVVSGGRGVGSAESFKLIEALADALGAAVGASRAAVDAGFVPNDYQVGQTGKVVAPELYIAVGISGAIQHLAGMSNSKTIVAINKDPDAPIFQVADYGLVTDLFEAVPVLTAALAK